MYFEPNTVYHVFNQGNNRQPVFLSDDHYFCFLRKMRKHITPFAEFLAYCLMPNHFHWLLFTKGSGCEWRDPLPEGVLLPTLSLPKKPRLPRQELSHSINILLSSYTRYFNHRLGRSGALFRPHTKAKDGWCEDWITLTKADGWLDYRFSSQNDYAFQCFEYIHANPVKARIVKKPEDWAFSSARDYAGLRNGTLCNQNLARELLRL